MRSSWCPTDAELDAFAREHLSYEVRMLIGQSKSLDERHPSDDQDRQALIEALLVHLRLLDDFLGSKGQVERATEGDRDDVFAGHWVDKWEPCTFLSDDERKRVNAKVAHLSGRRLTLRDVQPDDIPPLVKKCCERLQEFFEHVERHNQVRAPAFACARRRVEQFLAGDPKAVA